MSTATWILRKTSTGTTLWQGEGALPPEVVVDPTQIRETFALSFPQVLVEWGQGDFDMLVVSQGASYRAGGVKAYTLPGKERIEDASQVALTPHARGCEARIVTGDMLSQDMVKAPSLPAPAVEVHVPVTAPREPVPTSAPRQDPADFTSVLLIASRKVLLRESDWADRCKEIPAAAAKARQNRQSSPCDVQLPSLTPVSYRGTTRREPIPVPMDVFAGSTTCQTLTYLRWLGAYQKIEVMLQSKEELDLSRCLDLSLQMVDDAHLLYMMEQGVGGNALGPDNVVFDRDLLSEEQRRADFIAAKDADYGQAIRRHGIPGAMVRLWDKFSRYTNLKAQDYASLACPTFEAAADSLKDLGGYSLILAGLFQEAAEPVAEARA